jgi:hypothetical protein
MLFEHLTVYLRFLEIVSPSALANSSIGWITFKGNPARLSPVPICMAQDGQEVDTMLALASLIFFTFSSQDTLN